MMARPWQTPQLLLAILVALVALTHQERRKTFMSVEEVPVSEPHVIATLKFVINDFNKKSDDKYNFRIVRVLKVQKQQIECFYSVFVVPWFEKYKILNKNCTDG
ncbi:cystatin-11 isoform X2 [Prionailurus viverrinus]|uniref:cystatin-11 isoform X2 n=1 Tax=Prionailurus bengalensis TaxID=37029 RepID=UPI001CA836E1|nr:cystatin-11 isoform X2 [Prionailurus bengalensis]XP_047710559.1 cystatin-11 isoform X2 [Prionailurus viverrinus]